MTIFTDKDGRGSQRLRETHARLVAARLDPSPLGEKQVQVEATALAAACTAVRDTYRCRDVRKELRRVILLCDEAGADGGIIAGPWPVTIDLPAAA